MNNNIKFFSDLILHSNMSAEEIYETIIKTRETDLHTKKIFRGVQNWKNCIYQGTIGENDFIMSDISSSSISGNNVALVYDDYKETMIKFIEEFREAWKKKPDENILLALVKFSLTFVQTAFNGAGRDSHKCSEQRKSVSQFDEEIQLDKYRISEFRQEGRNAMCCERNSTIGNIFQLAGFETVQISGSIGYQESSENHFFILVKHGPESEYYALIDAFNQIANPKILPAEIDLLNGFALDIVDRRTNKTYKYSLNGPLIEMTDDILALEADLRKINRLAESVMERNGKIPNREEELAKIEVMYNNILSEITNGNYDQLLKERYIKTFNARLGLIQKRRREAEGWEL